MSTVKYQSTFTLAPNTKVFDGTEYIEILTDTNYGCGFIISEEAKKLYVSMGGNLSDFIYDPGMYLNKKVRTNKLLIEVYRKLCVSGIAIEKINIIYEDFFDIHEYDGSERVEINYDAFNLDLARKSQLFEKQKHDKNTQILLEIKKIIENGLTAEEKVAQIKALL